MICKTCKTPLAEGANACPNCGTTLAEMGVVLPKARLSKNDDKADFQSKAAKFGGIEVKERKASMLAGIDMKLLSLGMLAVLIVIFIVLKVVYDHKMVTAKFSEFEVSLPASMRSVDDHSFEVTASNICKAYSDSSMEFTYVQYDATTFIPELTLNPGIDDIEGMKSYYAAQERLRVFDKEFPDKLDETFEEDLKDYKVISKNKNELAFTYKEKNGVTNFVEMHIEVVDEKVYQFSVMCADDLETKYRKKIDTIFDSIKFK